MWAWARLRPRRNPSARPPRCDNRSPPTGTIILASRSLGELWCSLPEHAAKVLRGCLRFMLAVELRFRAQNTSPFSKGSDGGARNASPDGGHTLVTWLPRQLLVDAGER